MTKQIKDSRDQSRMLRAFGFGILLLAVIVLISVVARFPWVEQYDASVMQVVYSWRNDVLTSCLSVFTNFGDVLANVVLAVAVVAWLIVAKRYRDLTWFLFAYLLGQVILWGVKFFVGRVRPTDYLIALPSDPSFPSGHSFTSFMICACILALVFMARSWNGKQVFVTVLAIVFVLFIIAIGFSRIYLGVHWPSDVLEGWLLAGGWFMVSLSIYWPRRVA